MGRLVDNGNNVNKRGNVAQALPGPSGKATERRWERLSRISISSDSVINYLSRKVHTISMRWYHSRNIKQDSAARLSRAATCGEGCFTIGRGGGDGTNINK